MRKTIRNIGLLLCLAVMLVVLSACQDGGGDAVPNDTPPQTDAPTHDREGFPITLPERVDTIISIGPSITEILVALGFGDAIIQADRHSADIYGIQPEVATFDLVTPDLERIIDLNPDIIFVTGIARIDGDDDPFAPVTAVGITVIYMPSSASIADIKEDIRFMAAVLGADSEGEEIIEHMSIEIDRIREIGETITEKRTVYFEISPMPHMISFGSGTFLNEMIELVGAVNVFADQEGWVRVSDEVLLEINPDVIITSVDFIDDPVGEIMERQGWGAITAVQNEDVFVIDTDSSNRPNHNIVIALRQIAEAVYPDKFR
jgi:iron complex transport system substrate-binding protein